MVIVLTKCRQDQGNRWSCFWKLARQKCFSNLPAHIFECVLEHIPFVSKKVITNTQTQKKATNEEKRHTKETKEKKEKKILLL